jgi:adenosylcobinamide kinase / adenosylcobinamide-phosphate guanylyltransferase
MRRTRARKASSDHSTNDRQRRSRLILVLGGAASGKSRVALDLAGGTSPKAFVATGQALDREMAERIRRHRASRAADWATAEIPINLPGWFRDHAASYRTIVVDCLTLWLSNLKGQRISDKAIPERVGELLDAIGSASARVVLVTNELGLGLVPVSRAGRRFRDMAGKVHQQIATGADEVHLVVAGLSLRVK